MYWASRIQIWGCALASQTIQSFQSITLRLINYLRPLVRFQQFALRRLQHRNHQKNCARPLRITSHRTSRIIVTPLTSIKVCDIFLQSPRRLKRRRFGNLLNPELKTESSVTG